VEEVVAAEAGISLATLRVEDPEGRPPPRRAVSIACDQRLRPLAHDVASEPDPRPPGELEAQARGPGDGGREVTGESRRLEHDEERLRATGECRQPPEPIGDPGRLVGRGQPATGQVEDEHVRRAAGKQHAADGEPLVERLRGDDHEPVEPDAASDRLDRVEAARQVEPGHERERSRHTPIIFVTAFPDERTRNDVLNAGAIGFLSKPYSNEKLAKFLDMALANQSPE